MHYKNGREAKEGDIVIGTTYNRQGTQIGVIYGIKQNTDKCNCTIVSSFDRLIVGYSNVLFAPKTLPNGSPDFDYSDCGSLLHIEDYIQELNDAARATPQMGEVFQQENQNV